MVLMSLHTEAVAAARRHAMDWSSDSENSLMGLQLHSPFTSSSSLSEMDSGDSRSLPSPAAPCSSPRESEEKRCPTKLLPPCRVCGEPASGFHYGVNTCEACKGFFRRSIQRKKAYKCSGKGKCIIEPGKRSACSHCRYIKCQDVGMSQNAIKTGRYTHAKRTSDIQEIKRIKGQKEIETKDNNNIDQETIISALEKSQKENPTYSPDLLEKLGERQEQYMHEFEFIRGLFGPDNHFSMDEFTALYLQTGVDVDGRISFIKKLMPTVENNSKKFIKFAKSIPGFKDIELDDQVKLIKAARLEALLISSHKGVHPTNDVFVNGDGDVHHLDELSVMFSREFWQAYFHLARKLQSFNLLETEINLVKAIVVLFSDRVPLNNPSAVENMQRRLADILEQKLAQNHPDERQLFARILSFTCDLRHLTAQRDKDYSGLKNLLVTLNVDIPPLLLELNK